MRREAQSCSSKDTEKKQRCWTYQDVDVAFRQERASTDRGDHTSVGTDLPVCFDD